MMDTLAIKDIKVHIMSDEKNILVENPYHTARLKPLRKGKKGPQLLAVVHQSGCTGCEVCIAGCPVDSIELVPGPDASNPGFKQTVEIDLARCIGCQNCSQDCPWETIMMYKHDDAFKVWGHETLKSELYVSTDTVEKLNESHGIKFDPPAEEENSETSNEEETA
ncbi:MAG: 4Fe-4S dicluster domain-containing protein [Bdellovibrionota bacterium]|nr:4Fe-4S dicluster domain-containing protein [Bdellovibrionota bacterium]